MHRGGSDRIAVNEERWRGGVKERIAHPGGDFEGVGGRDNRQDEVNAGGQTMVVVDDFETGAADAIDTGGAASGE